MNTEQSQVTFTTRTGENWRQLNIIKTLSTFDVDKHVNIQREFSETHLSIIISFYKQQRPWVREKYFQTYSVRRVEMNENKNMYVTVAFAGVALMVALLIGVVVMRRRNTRYPHHQVKYHHYPHYLSLSLSLSLSISYFIFLYYTTQTLVQGSEIDINFIFSPMNVK